MSVADLAADRVAGLSVRRRRRPAMAGDAYDRRYDPAGGARQFAAILGSPGPHGGDCRRSRARPWCCTARRIR